MVERASGDTGDTGDPGEADGGARIVPAGKAVSGLFFSSTLAGLGYVFVAFTAISLGYTDAYSFSLR